MKRGMKSGFILIVFVLFGVFLIGGVSADMNYAASANGGVASETGIPRGTSSGAIANTNDGDVNTYWQRRDYRTLGRFGEATVYGEFTVEIVFAETLPTLNDVKYWVYWSNNGEWGAPIYSRSLSYSIYYSGAWHEIGTDTSTGGVTISGPWNNVTKIKLDLYTQTNLFGTAVSNWVEAVAGLYELEAWGPSCGDGICDAEENCFSCSADCGCTLPDTCVEGACACTPQTCIDLGKECGTWDDGCSGTVDCEGCTGGEICQDGICVASLTNAYWANMEEETITTAHLNDKVKLMVAGEGMEDKEIDYEIWKSIKFWFDDKVADTDTLGFITWRASEAGTYYFIADVDGVTQQSGDLIVSNTEDNFAPVVNIITPEKSEIYSIDEAISFSETDYDEDDDVTILWDFGDGTTSTEHNPTHSYDTPGQYTITKTVTDDRGAVTTERVSILIIDVSIGADTKYVFAYIDYPEWGESLFGRVVSFNASSSYAIETTGCDGSSCTINCLGGGCPLETHAGGSAINNGNRGNYNALNFSWTFDDGSWKNGTGLVEFDWVFRTAGKHKTWLSVSKNPVSLTEVEFNSFFSNPSCYRDKSDDNTYWYENWNIIPSLNDCYRDSELNPQPTGECCPPSYVCDTGTGACEELEGIASCAQYNEEKCGTNVFVAQDDLDPILEDNGLKCGGSKEYGTECWEIIDCKCSWNSTLSKCLSVTEQIVCNTTTCWDKTNIPSDIQTQCNAEGLPFSGDCSFNFAHTDKCETDGFIERIWNAVWDQSPIIVGTSPAYCTADSDQINCKVTQLTFFTITSLIITILVIIIIYWFIIRKGKKKSSKRKKR